MDLTEPETGVVLEGNALHYGTLIIELLYFSEMSVNFCQNTRKYTLQI
jgi:hypothetical protein